jgi:hypothetical protein
MSDTPSVQQAPTRRKLLARSVRLPRLSGKASAGWLVVCFVLTGLLIPAVVRLPLWIDFEIVLAGWWLVWLAVLSHLLYWGQRVADDHQMQEPRNWFATAKEAGKKTATADRNSRWWDIFFGWTFIGDFDGLAFGCLLIVGLVMLVGVAWLLIEVAVPVVVFLLYFLTRGMLAHVVNDRHRCRGSLGRALAWGCIWATAYTAPLAGVVWLVHHVRSSQAIG